MASPEKFQGQSQSCGKCKTHFSDKQPRHGRCITCQKDLCRKCYAEHLLEGEHELTEKEIVDHLEQCEICGSKKIKYFCVSHGEFMCSTCQFKKAKTTECSVKSILEVNKGDLQLQWTNVRDNLDRGLGEADAMSQEIESDKNIFSEYWRQCQKDFAAFSEGFYSKIEQKRTELRNLERSAVHQFASAQKTCDDIIDNIETVTSKMQAEAHLQLRKRLFITVQKSKEDLPKICKSLEEAKTNAHFAARVFIPDAQLRSKMTRTRNISKRASQPAVSDMSSCGGGKCHDFKTKWLPETELSKNSDEELNEKDVTHQVTCIDYINQVDVDRNSVCNIAQAIVLSDGRLALIDRDNACIKVFNRENNVVEKDIKLEEFPYSMIESQYPWLIVSFPKQCTIVDINISTGDQPYARRTEFPCYNMVRLKEHFVCCVAEQLGQRSSCMLQQRVLLHRAGSPSPHRVLYSDTSLTALAEIEAGALQVYSNSNKDILYVFNKREEKLISMDLDGKTLGEGRGLDGMSGLCVDRFGYLFVSYGHGSRMLQLSAELERICDIQVPEHKAVACSLEDDSVFFVARGQYEDEDKVLAYSFKRTN